MHLARVIRPERSGMWLCFALLWPWVCAGQARMKFNRFDRHEALSENIIYRISEDRQGLLWLATYNGLLRYDGYTFTPFYHDPENDSSVSAGPVTHMHLDRQGKFWLIIQGVGIDMFDPFTGKTRHCRMMAGDAPATNFTSIAEDVQGNLWFASAVQGIFRLDPVSGQVRHFSLGANNSVEEPYILVDKLGKIWITSLAHGLHYYDIGADQIKPWIIAGREQQLYSSHIFQGRAGLMWIPTAKTLDAYRLPHWTKVHSIDLGKQKPFGEGTLVKSIIQDRDGKIWISTNSKGLMVYDTGSHKLKQFCYDRDDPIGLPTNNLTGLYEDKAGNIWIGSGKGLFKLSPLQSKIRCFVYTRPDPDPALATSSIRCVVAPPGDVAWAGSASTGLHAIEKDGTITPYFFEDKTGQPGFNCVNDMSRSSRGELLLGTGHGLWVFDPVRRRYTDHYVLDSLIGKGKINYCAVWASYEDKEGYIWIGTKNHGLVRLDRRTGLASVAGEAYSRSEQPGLLRHVWCIFPDRNGITWIGTGDGLKKVVIRGGKAQLLKDYKPDKNNAGALRGRSIFRIAKDKRGNIWVATVEGGLSRLDVKTGVFRTFREQDGLPSNSVSSLEKDKKGQLWVSTSGGLCVVDPESERILRSYDASDGLLSNHYNFGASAVSEDGHIFFGSSAGVERFRPDRILRNTFHPRIALNSFRVLYQDRLAEMLRDSFLSLDHDQNSFSVDFASLDFTNPEKNTFSYKLAGLDKDWQSSGTRHYAAFTNLAPGDYTLYIRGTNSEGEPSDKIASFRIHIRPPVWRTWWFYMLGGLTAAGSGAYIFSTILRRKNAERQRIRSELTALRAQLNPHFMFNSLSALQRFIMKGEEEPALRYLSKFSRLLRKILENSRHEWISLREELEFLDLYFYMEGLRMNNKVKFILHADPALDPNLVRVPSMLLQPLVENSLIHGLVAGKMDGFVQVSFMKKDGGLLCTVEDNGVGRAQAQANKQEDFPKSSIGLKLIEERLVLLSAEGNSQATIKIIDLTDSEGRPCGTRTEINIPEPVLQKHYV